MLLSSASPTVAEFARATGWELEPQGACQGDVCIPLTADSVVDGTVDLATVTERLGMGLVSDAESGLFAVGPASPGGRVLVTTEAPDLELPDFDGNPFRLGSLRGTKVVLVAWAPY